MTRIYFCMGIFIDNNIVIAAAIRINRKIKLYDSLEGNDLEIPSAVLITLWLACISIPATAGPMADPIYLNKVFIPKDTPIFLGETEIVFILSWPTFKSAKPTPTIARFIANCIALA